VTHRATGLKAYEWAEIMHRSGWFSAKQGSMRRFAAGRSPDAGDRSSSSFPLDRRAAGRYRSACARSRGEAHSSKISYAAPAPALLGPIEGRVARRGFIPRGASVPDTGDHDVAMKKCSRFEYEERPPGEAKAMRRRCASHHVRSFLSKDRELVSLDNEAATVTPGAGRPRSGGDRIARISSPAECPRLSLEQGLNWSKVEEEEHRDRVVGLATGRPPRGRDRGGSMRWGSCDWAGRERVS